MMRRWMTLTVLVLLIGLCCGVREVSAGPFNSGIGSAMYYGPYTGGHGYSYAEAYHYGLSFSAGDSWRRDPLAYPAGIPPYRLYYPLYPYFQARHNGIVVPGAVQPEVVPLQLLPPQAAPGAISGAAPVSAQAAIVQVTVPADAEVWVEGDKTGLTGTRREFVSPPLAAGRNYLYTVRARWTETGRAFEQIQVVAVQAGNRAEVRFPAGHP